MRPARKGPENASIGAFGPRPLLGFNEAGPQGAGKLPAAGAEAPSAVAPLQ